MPTIATATATGPPGEQVLAFPNPFSWGAGKVIGWIVKGITKAINAFFSDLIKSALNPLLKLLGQTLLTTPNPSKLPRVGTLWENSREIAVAAYALLILIAAILVMAYETVQTRHSIKEIAPRIVVGFITANMSLLLAGKAVSFANALSTGVVSGGVDPKSAASTLTSLVMNAVTNGGIFLVFIGIALAVILIALLVCYVIRVALTVILIAGAPLALMCHALPQTEGIARWWWRAFAGVLGIQIAQSLTLVAALNVFLAKGGFGFFGPTKSGLVDVIVTLALLYILWKIPFWILHSVQVGGGRSFVGSAAKAVIAYKTLGLLGLRGSGSAARARRPGSNNGSGGSGLGPGPGPGGPPGGPVRRRGGPGPSRGPAGADARRATPGARDAARRVSGPPRASTANRGRRASSTSSGTVAGDPPAPVRPAPRLATARAGAPSARRPASTELPRGGHKAPPPRPTQAAPAPPRAATPSAPALLRGPASATPPPSTVAVPSVSTLPPTTRSR